MTKIRPKVALIAFSLLLPILGFTYYAQADQIESSAQDSDCEQLVLKHHAATEMASRYQPLIGRGAFYRNAHSRFQAQAGESRVALEACR